MLFTSPTRRIGFTPRKTWTGAAILTLGFLFGSSAVMAVAPPANTIIGNQASATYLDPTGNSQLATSNLVQTTVQQVGSFTLDTYSTVTTNVVNTKVGAAGATVYAPHVLTNTGNGTDTFSLTVGTTTTAPVGFTSVSVYADVNGDGIPDSTTALCTAVPNTTCTVPAQTVAGNNGVFQFVVAYSIPSTATNPSFGTQAATITATPTTTALYALANQSAADKDNVTLTTAAAFNATKGLSVPAVAWSANGGTWPTASASGPRSTASICPVTSTTVFPVTPGCVYTVYTLNISNTGAAVGQFTITDTLPAGFTYVTGSAVWSNAPGVPLTDAATGDPTGIDYKASGSNVAAVVAALAPNTSQTISFVVLVNGTAAIGTSTTTNTAMYSPVDSSTPAPGSTSTAPQGATSATNPSPFTVTGTFGIVLGSAASTATATTALDSALGIPNTTANDTTTLATAVAGSTVKFAQQVFNTGNGSDTVNLTAALGTFPAGTTFKFFAADGLTPLIDNNSDGIVDTGPIAAGGVATIYVAATLPAMAAASPAGGFSAIVKGASTGDNTKTETTRDTITAIIGVLVDLTNSAGGNTTGADGTTSSGDVGTGPSPNPTTIISTAAGSVASFPLYVKNNDSGSTTYNLAASQTTSFPGSLPTGWTVTFGTGSTCTSPVTSITVAAGSQGLVNACVTPPTSQVPVTAVKIYFRVYATAAGSTGAFAIDTKTDAVTVTVAATYSATLTPNNNGQVAPGGSVVYAHTLTNTGAQSCGVYTSVTASLPAADVAAGWTTAIYIDNNGDGMIDAADTLVTSSYVPPALLAGGTQKLLVKVFAPGGAVAGATDTATVTVTFPGTTTSCGTPSATDVSTVITGQIRLTKLQILDTACTGMVTPISAAPILNAKPGQCIVYSVTATNQGSAPVTNMSINDAVPAYTSLTGATQPGSKCTSLNVTAPLNNSNYASTSSTVSCGSTGNTVQPGGTATLNFNVQINP